MDGVARAKIPILLRILFGKWTADLLSHLNPTEAQCGHPCGSVEALCSPPSILTSTLNESNRRPDRWRATGRVLSQAESNHEYGSEEPLNFDCADHDPLCNSDDDFDDDDDSYSSIDNAEAQTY